MTMRWYVVHVYSNFERKVADAIREKAAQKGLEDRFEQILVPTEEVVEVRRGTKYNTERKFFPGYVLAKMDLTDETWHLVKNTPKVTGFLSSGRRGEVADQGRGLHLRPLDSGRAGVHPGRAGLIRGRIGRGRQFVLDFRPPALYMHVPSSGRPGQGRTNREAPWPDPPATPRGE